MKNRVVTSIPIRRMGGESSKKASRINHYGKTGSMSPEENDEMNTKDP